MTQPLLIFGTLLCLDLNHIRGSDNCITAMESLAHAVDNTDKLCCPIKSKKIVKHGLKKALDFRRNNIKH